MNKKIILLIVLSLIIIGLYSVLGINKISIKNTDTYTYIANQVVGFSGDYDLKFKDNTTKLEYEGRNYYLDSIPLYYLNDTRFILTKDMMMIETKTGNLKKLNKYSEIYYENNQYFVSEKNKKLSISEAILFDGKSTYISLISGTINAEGNIYSVTPFSTIFVDSEVHLFNYDEKEYRTLVNPEMLIFDETNLLDVENNIITIDGKKILLIQDFEKIENIFKE